MKKGDDVERSTLLTGDDVFLFNEGTHHRLYEKLGSHLASVDGVDGAYFAVWAPNAERVAVIGEFNDWNPDATPLTSEGVSGIWEAFVPHVGHVCCQIAHSVPARRLECSGQPWPLHTGQAGSATIAASGHFATHTPQSSHVYGSISKMPRNESVFTSASVWHEKSHAPHPMHRSWRTWKLMRRWSRR